eukprot:CAMPEP_0114146690 /NCGR_PEP_ID=MMETSP0043_2-20121206/20700_1 /TAXON_ID=464988 /ORGANISM="Hemiselmis andersenii, Strain CCMP644" /LENGTH=105 /DNA_ID=CAMNT_0001241163 /DNA_START=85 /DNA_END=402 /DNA_ORIENTATION=+
MAFNNHKQHKTSVVRLCHQVPLLLDAGRRQRVLPGRRRAGGGAPPEEEEEEHPGEQDACDEPLWLPLLPGRHGGNLRGGAAQPLVPEPGAGRSTFVGCRAGWRPT